MTMILEDLATYVATQVPSLVLGTNMFLDYHPETPNQVVVLSEYGAMQPMATMTNKPLLELPRLQVYTRDDPQEVSACHDRARLVYDALCNLVNVTVGSRVYTLEPLDTPYLVGRDEQQRVEFVNNWQVHAQ